MSLSTSPQQADKSIFYDQQKYKRNTLVYAMFRQLRVQGSIFVIFPITGFKTGVTLINKIART